MQVMTGGPAAAERELMERAMAEYREMPGVALSAAQAARLWHVPLPQAEHVLAVLAQRGYLARAGRGTFVLASGSPLRRPSRAPQA